MKLAIGRIVGGLGLVLVVAVVAHGQVMLNPSFEEEVDGLMPNGFSTESNPDWGMPVHWTWRRVGNANGHGIRGPQGWATDGEWGLYMFAMVNNVHERDDHLEWYQAIDLTDVEGLLFDVRLASHRHTAAYVAVDGNSLWTSSTEGEHLSVFVDLTGHDGVHEVGVGIVVLETFTSPSVADGRTWWDRLELAGAVTRDARSWTGVKALFR